MTKRFSSIATLLMVAGLLAGCAGGGTSADGTYEGDTLTVNTSLLTMIDCGDYTIATVKNPWDTTRLLATYALVPRGTEAPDLPADVKVISTPVESSLIYSSVHTGALKELGAISAVTGVADATYYKLPEITEGLKSGKIVDVGSSMSPNVEMIATLSPDVMLVSPFENAGHGVIEKLGIPILECADYMESTPLARAEWIKLLGALVGNYEQADSIYSATVSAYTTLAEQAKSAKSHPKVLLEQLTDGVWYMPGGNSYHARLLADAGASYAWSDDTSTGSLQLGMETVLDRNEDADVWLIRSFNIPVTLAGLGRDNPLNKRFKAYKEGEVWFCDTGSSMLYEEFPFHPERLLNDYIMILHPGLLGDGATMRYYQRAK